MWRKSTDPSRSPGAGCLLLVGIFIVLLVGSVWALREPQRRAQRIQQAITVGMTLEQVEACLEGRTVCLYQILRGSAWSSLDRAQFVRELASAEGRRVDLTVLSPRGAPGRISFYVEFDGEGKVSAVMPSRGWD